MRESTVSPRYGHQSGAEYAMLGGYPVQRDTDRVTLAACGHRQPLAFAMDIVLGLALMTTGGIWV
ncbi:MAG: hypothetical protein NTU83_06570 [Candidatus Hydrogenedentes bacterium]|nr:hypothetical protein [Candidatus Hydrogenedentota bacterium]